MATHSYQQNSVEGPRPPRALRLFIPGTVILVASYIALPIVMMINRDDLAANIMENDPNLDPSHLDFAITASLVYTNVLHALDVVVIIWFVLKAMRGRRWARIALTIYLIIAFFGSLYSAAQGSEYLWAVIIGDGIHVAMLVALWVPKSVREFFDAHRQAANTSQV